MSKSQVVVSYPTWGHFSSRITKVKGSKGELFRTSISQPAIHAQMSAPLTLTESFKPLSVLATLFLMAEKNLY